MSDSCGWPFDSPDLLRVPFIFVPHGASEPREWLARHPGAIRIPARFVPRGEADGRGALDADLNDALRQWLGGATGDDTAPISGPVQGDARVPRHTRLADLLASNASGEAEASTTGTPLDPALMKFLVGKYDDIAVQAAQMNADMSETLLKKWLAGWQKPQNVSPAGLPDPPLIHAGSEARDGSAPPPGPPGEKLSRTEAPSGARVPVLQPHPDANCSSASGPSSTAVEVNLPGVGPTWLDYDFAKKVGDLIQRAKADHINRQFTSGYRTQEERDALRKSGKGIAPAQYSPHSTGRAVDFQRKLLSAQQLHQLVLEAGRLGLRYGGNFRKPDRVHFDASHGGDIRPLIQQFKDAVAAAKENE